MAMDGGALEACARALDEADAFLIGASNGLDMAEGLNLFRADAHFLESYGDFAEAYGVSSILHGLAARWPSDGLRWAFEARFAQVEWLDYRPGRAMGALLEIVGGRPSFVVTCNASGRFERAGFDPGAILETEGSARQLVCAAGCCDARHTSEPAVRGAVRGGAVPGEPPRCPACGAPLRLALDERRLARPDGECLRLMDALEGFARSTAGKRLAVLELGVGLRNQAVKPLLARVCASNPRASYVVLNYDQVVLPRAFAGRSWGFDDDMGVSLRALADGMKGGGRR